MPDRKYSRKKPTSRPFPLLALAAPAAVILVLIIGSFGFAASMEENDSFCASCHTQPESTFYQRNQSTTPADLASFHHTKETKCIDCHSGNGLPGRAGAILLGSRNALAYFTHTAHQPAPLTVAISDANCVKCHAAVMAGQPAMNNHFHLFLVRWQAVDPSAAGCVGCHASHSTDGDAQIGYLNEQQTQQVCDRCHSVLAQ
jgi:predicted CXXCH cytochrome family protein